MLKKTVEFKTPGMHHPVTHSDISFSYCRQILNSAI